MDPLENLILKCSILFIIRDSDLPWELSERLPLAEANEPSLHNRRLKLSMQYTLKLKSNPSNPTYKTVFEPKYKTLFENKPNMIPSFGIRISSELENMNLDLENIADFKISDVQPWTVYQPCVLFSLHNDKSL